MRRSTVLTQNKKTALVEIQAEDSAKAKELFLRLYPQNLCNVTLTAKAAGVSRATYYNWIKDDPEFAKGITEGQKEIVEAAETQLTKNFLAGKEASLFFYLTNMKPDLWKQRQPIGGYGPQNVTINYGYRNGNPNGNEGDNDKPLRREAGRLVVPSPPDAADSPRLG